MKKESLECVYERIQVNIKCYFWTVFPNFNNKIIVVIVIIKIIVGWRKAWIEREWRWEKVWFFWLW